MKLSSAAAGSGLVVLLVVALVVSMLQLNSVTEVSSLATKQDPSEDSQDEEEEEIPVQSSAGGDDDDDDDDMIEPFTADDPSLRRTFVFAVRPYLSSDGGGDASNVFGYFFSNEMSQQVEDRDTISQHSLYALEQQQDQQQSSSSASASAASFSHKVAAVRAARTWAYANAHLIFRTIFSLEYVQDETTRTALQFKSLHEKDDAFHIVLQEKSPGVVTSDMLVALRDNVITGADSWDGGDFGSFTMPYTTKDKDNDNSVVVVNLRLTLCKDPNADWVDPPIQPWPPPKQECQNVPYYYLPQQDSILKLFLKWLLQ